MVQNLRNRYQFTPSVSAIAYISLGFYFVFSSETTKALVIEKLKSLGAEVEVHGVNWNAADKLARERVDADPTAKYVSP